MYTSNDMETNDYEDYEEELENEEEEESFYQRNKSIIFKVLIIILCVIILLWLISKLGKTNKVVPSNYENNVKEVRLASERYFFIINKPTSNNQVITVNNLINENLIDEVKNSDGSICRNDSTIQLENNGISYLMTITLDCGKEKVAKTYEYRLSDYACLDCGSETYMVPTDDNPITPDDDYYTCDWSKWTTEKNYSNYLEEKTRITVKAVKQEVTENVTYGEWSEYTESEIVPTDTLEVESKLETVDSWVDKTSSSKVSESATIRNVTKKTSGGSSYKYCPDGYEPHDGKCRKGNEKKTISATDYVKSDIVKIIGLKMPFRLTTGFDRSNLYFRVN